MLAMGFGTSMNAKAWGRVHSISASELNVRTVANCGKTSDTPPVLKESDLHFRIAQNQQRIDTLIIQARRQFHHRNISQMALLPLAILRIPRVLAFLQTPRPGTRNDERSQKRNILVITMFEMCLHGSLSNLVAVVRPT